jgi:hypothetical protein
MYDENTVFFVVGMSTDDYLIFVQLARRKNMTRTQLIMEALRQYLISEQDRWRKEEEEKRMIEKLKPVNPQTRREGEDSNAGKKEKGGEG